MLFNPQLDMTHERAALDRSGRAQIRDVLAPETATELHRCLENDTEWTLAWHDSGRQSSQSMPREQYRAMAEDERRESLAELARGSMNRYGFAYEHYPMVTAHMQGWNPDHRLHRLVEEMNSEPFLAVARQLTGFNEIRRVSAQATRYRAGHFLRMHTDDVREEGRLAAYVLNLTPTWNVDFGGLLHFIGNDGGVEDIYFPWFNSMSVFKVPRWHFVSMVMPWVPSGRLSITGWFQR